MVFIVGRTSFTMSSILQARNLLLSIRQSANKFLNLAFEALNLPLSFHHCANNFRNLAFEGLDRILHVFVLIGRFSLPGRCSLKGVGDKIYEAIHDADREGRCSYAGGCVKQVGS